METEWVETFKGAWNTLVFDNLKDIMQILKEKTTAIDRNQLHDDSIAVKQIVGFIQNFI